MDINKLYADTICDIIQVYICDALENGYSLEKGLWDLSQLSEYNDDFGSFTIVTDTTGETEDYFIDSVTIATRVAIVRFNGLRRGRDFQHYCIDTEV